MLVSPALAMGDFVYWVQAQERRLSAAGDKMVIVSDTSSFDGGVANYHLARYSPDLCSNLVDITGQYRPTRDMSSFYFGVGKRFQVRGSTDTALETFGETTLPDWVKAYAHNHDPLSDANSIGAMASYFLSKCE